MMLGRYLPHHTLRPYLAFLGIYAALMILTAPLQNLMVVEGRERMAALSMIGFSLLDVVVLPGCTYLLPRVTDMSALWGLLYGIVIAAGIKALITVSYIGVRYLRQPVTSPPFMREQLQYGLPVGLTAMVYVINVNIDKFLVGLFFSSAVFAYYYIGSLWVLVFGWISQSTAQVVIPRLSAAHKREALEEMARLRGDMARRMGLIFFTLCLALAVVARPLIEILFTTSYSKAVPIFLIYLLILPSRPFGYGEVLMATGQTRFLFRVAASMALINVVLSYLLLRWFGLWGLPWATVTVSWLTTVLIFMRSNRTLKLSLRQAYPWRYILSTLVASILAALPPAALLLLGLEGWILLVGALALYALIFFPLATKLKVLGPEEWKLLRVMIPFGR